MRSNSKRDVIEEFAREVEEIVWDRDVPYLDAALIWAERKGVEPEMITDLIKKTHVKGMIEQEAEKLNLIPKTNRLPV